MAEGFSEKVSQELMSLEPTAMIEFFTLKSQGEIYLKEGTNGELPSTAGVYYFHSGSLFGGSIWWQGRLYAPLALEIEDNESSVTAGLNRPKLTVANPDYIISDIMKQYNDLRAAVIYRQKTFVRFLDDANFEGLENPWGEADSSAQISNQRFLVSRKIQENKYSVLLELTSPLDMDTIYLNGRRIMSKYCSWTYRGPGCRYSQRAINTESGLPFTDENGVVINQSTDPGILFDYNQSYSKGDTVRLLHYGRSKNIGTTNYEGSVITGADDIHVEVYVSRRDNNINRLPRENPDFWQLDGCNKSIESCQEHFRDFNDDKVALPFGGFPGTDGFQFKRTV